MRLFSASKFMLVAVASLVSLPAFGGDTMITYKDGSRTHISSTNTRGSFITHYDKNGRQVSFERSELDGSGGHRALINKYRRGGKVQTHWD